MFVERVERARDKVGEVGGGGGGRLSGRGGLFWPKLLKDYFADYIELLHVWLQRI